MLQHLLFIIWDPNPDVPFTHIGNFSIKWYGIMWGLSLFSGFLFPDMYFANLARMKKR